jgi:hypothetical protein
MTSHLKTGYHGSLPISGGAQGDQIEERDGKEKNCTDLHQRRRHCPSQKRGGKGRQELPTSSDSKEEAGLSRIVMSQANHREVRGK